ncbi:MAG: AmmeMemoRadiSam system protein B [Acidobacteriota bacterium]
MKNKNILFLMFILLLFVISLYGSNTRGFLYTGSWYPSNKKELNKLLDGYFDNTGFSGENRSIVGLISPHAGFSYSGKCSAAAFSKLKKRKDVKRVIILGVAHRGGFRGASLCNFSYYSTPLGKIRVDRMVMKRLSGYPGFSVSDRISRFEHSIENQLPFIQKALKDSDYKIVPILFSNLKPDEYKRMAKLIGRFVNKNTIIIASTDFTHYGRAYGYIPFRENIPENLRKLDMGIIEHIRKLDFKEYVKYKNKTGITMCGFAPVGILIFLMNDKKCKTSITDYYRSADLNKDYSLSVSYASIIFYNKVLTPEKNSLSRKDKKKLLSISRYTINKYIETGIIPEIDHNFSIEDILKEKRGLFVTLKKGGKLRGCIGTLRGIEPLYIGVARNSVNSAFRDPRFPALKKGELEKIEIEISVMTPLKKIKSYRKIRLGTDGVILKRGNFQAVYLPQVAVETGWGLETFLGNLSKKAGLNYNGYRSKETEFYIFQADVFSEHDLKK